jgi:hypothetical protein
MTDPKPPEAAADEQEPKGADSLGDSKDEDAMAALLRRSMAGGPVQHAAKDLDLLHGVQRRIRQRSKGKFFSDGWSTNDSRFSYAIVALAMLLVVGVAYFALAWITVR